MRLRRSRVVEARHGTVVPTTSACYNVDMTWRGARFLDHPGPRRSADYYDQTGESVVLEPGDRLFLPCVDGPAASRLEIFPPRLEVTERGGLYVLVDDGPRSEWHYLFVPEQI
jgi:hypothetical protein